MHITALLLAAAASLVTAQSIDTILPTPTASAASGIITCQAQQILDTCVSQRQPIISACPGNDYSCLCQQYGNLLTCYDNCPGDPLRFGASQQQAQNCMAASQYGTTTLMVAASTSSASSRATAATESGSSDSSESETASGSAASATETGAAAPLTVEITGGLLAAVAVGFGFFL